MVDLVNDDSFGPTSKRELVAALAYAAEPDAAKLWAGVIEYRRATVGDAAFWVDEPGETIEFQERKQGRRPR